MFSVAPSEVRKVTATVASIGAVTVMVNDHSLGSIAPKSKLSVTSPSGRFRTMASDGFVEHAPRTDNPTSSSAEVADLIP